jgi:hypothetical protein
MKTTKRTIKVEQLGDPFHRKTHSGIRLKGKWLEKMGFAPGGHVEVSLIAPGSLTLNYLPFNY